LALKKRPVGAGHSQKENDLAEKSTLFGAGVLGDSLGALGHRVLGQLAGQQQAHGRLDLARRNGRAAIVRGQLGALVGDPLEDVVDK